MSIYDSTQMIRDDRDLRIFVKEMGSRPERVAKAVLPERPGVYGIFASKADGPSTIQFRRTDFLYLGKSTDLTGRGHFEAGRTSRSTLRRMLGALLKQELGLRAYARGRGRVSRDFTHYWFDASGEEKLTEWMNTNLCIGYSIVVDDVDDIERRLIRYCEPILNLTLWANPQAKKIKELRKICADEARTNGPLQDRRI